MSLFCCENCGVVEGNTTTRLDDEMLEQEFCNLCGEPCYGIPEDDPKEDK